MSIFIAVFGSAILLIGRQLFWVAVSGLGFILGLSYATQYYQGSPHIIVLISLGVGLIGAVLAYSLQRAAAGLVGFLAGWYLTLTLINYINWDPGSYGIILTIAGGLIGVGFIAVLFDWSLILLSTMAGSAMVVQALNFKPSINTTLFILLFVFGTTIQGIMLSQENSDFR
jgi:hypothetical protein